MAEGVTLQELKVLISASIAGYKKDMEKVKAETRKAKEAINGETAKIQNSFGKMSSDKAQKTIQALTGKLDKQRESISAQEAVIQNLQNKYTDLMSGVTADRGASSIERQLKSAEKEFSKVEAEMNKLLAKLNEAEEFEASGLKYPGMDQTIAQIDSLNPKYETLEAKVTRLRDLMNTAKLNPEGTTTAQQLKAQLDVATQKLERMRGEAKKTEGSMNSLMNTKGGETLKGKLNKIINLVKNVNTSVKGTTASSSKGFNQMGGAIERLKRRVTGLIASALLFNAFSAALTSVRKYMGAALKTSDEFNNSLNLAKTNLQVSFAAIYTAVLPALTAFMNAVATLSGMIASLLSRLFGKTYSDSYKVAQGLNTAAKAAENYGAASAGVGTLSFDEVNNLPDSSGGGGGGDAGLVDLETAATSTDSLFGSVFEKIKGGLATFFDPLKSAWDSQGLSVIASAQSAFQNIIGLGKAIGTSFAEVWGNGTGELVFSNLLSILGNVLQIIGNIAERFKTAWEMDGTGTAIIQTTLNILNNILGALVLITAATATWSAGLDLTPILTSFKGLLSALEPLSSTIMDGLVYLFENVLLPLAGWTIEDAIPVFLDLLSAAISGINSILETFAPLGDWLFQNFLTPIASWTGGAIVSILEGITTAITAIGDWIAEHQTMVETLAIILGSLATSITLVNTAMGIASVVMAIYSVIMGAGGITAAATAAATWALNGALAVLTSPITIVIAIIAALIAVGVLLYKNWDLVKAKCTEIWGAIKDFITATITKLKTGIDNTITSISTAWNNTWTNMKTATINIFTAIWDAIKGVINGIIGGVESMANAVINGINTIIGALNNLHFDIPDWIPGLGGKSFGFNIGLLGTVSLPRLQTGGVVNRSTIAEIGENGAEAIVPLERNTGWLDGIASRLGEILSVNLQAVLSEQYSQEDTLEIPISLLLDGKVLLEKLVKAKKRRGYPILQEV
ncbi:MAG: hypothetical protein PHX08_01780 [Lachnospiraceae bacterium]|nr:hypothetical protein [Lachnospiraceae bacterium]